MKRSSILPSAVFTLLAIGPSLGCSADDAAVLERESLAINVGPCALLNVSVLPDSQVSTSLLRDKLIQVLPTAPTCDLGGVTAALKAAGCSTETAIVSETAQMVGLKQGAKAVSSQNSFYRFVVRTTCDGMPSFGMMLSPLAGVRVAANAGVGNAQGCKAELAARTDTSPPLSIACTDDALKALCGAGTKEACFAPPFDQPKPCWPENQKGLDDQDFANDVMADPSQTRCFQAATNLKTAAVEISVFDETKGVFNFYEASGEGLKFFGSSDHFDGFYDQVASVGAMAEATEAVRTGARGVAHGDAKGKCAACHPGGGLVMKELASPWVHWEHFTATPGAAALRAAAPQILCADPTAPDQKTCNNNFFDGAALEPVIDEGNRAVNRSKIQRMRAAGNLRGLLRPLFCASELNIGSAGGVRSTTGPAQDLFVGSNALLDPAFSSISLQLPRASYDKAIDGLGQKVFGANGQVIDRDTFFELSFVEKGRMDVNYIGLFDQSPINNPDFDDSFGPASSLVGLGVITPAMAKAILAVDMGRPFSDLRCGLVSELPTSGESFLATGNGDARATATAGVATTLKTRLIDLMDGRTDPAAVRLATLLESDVLLTKPAEFGAKTRLEAELELAAADMGAMCQARMSNDPDAMTRDVVTVIHNHVNQAQGVGAAGGFAFIEGPGTMLATSNVAGEGGYLDPETCTLQAGPELRDPVIDFCTSPIVTVPGGWCYDSFDAADWSGVRGEKKRPAANAFVVCGKNADLGLITGFDNNCFNGCRRMADGFDDQCQSSVEVPFDICSADKNPGKRVVSFCDDPTKTAKKDKFECSEFGSASRLWCQTSCTGDFMNGSGQLVDQNGDGVISASCN